jgi:hypothetical protein
MCTYVCITATVGAAAIPSTRSSTSSSTKAAGTAPYYFSTPASTDFNNTGSSNNSSTSTSNYEAAPCSIRTRLYFTSESHVSAIVQLLQYPPPGAAPLLDTQARRLLAATPELCYLTQVRLMLIAFITVVSLYCVYSYTDCASVVASVISE